MKIQIVILLLSSLIAPNLMSQETDEEPLKNSPFHYSTILGTAFGYSPGLGSVTHMYAAPQLDYKLSNRIAFYGGMMVSQSISNMPLYPSELIQANSVSIFSVYISASYQLSENLYIHGTGLKGMVNPFMNDDVMSFDYQDLSIGATYVIGNFSIGASFHTSDRSSFYSPYYGNGMFGSSIF